MLGNNLRLGFRQAARNPAFTLAAVLTLALGIGANTALLDILDEALVRPLPLRDAGRIVAVFNVDRATSKYVSTSYPDYEDYARRSTSFEALSAYVRLPLNLAIGDDTVRLPVEAVTPDYFSMLRIGPVAGRAFRPGDGSPGAEPVVMLSERLWRARFQSDPAVLGRPITLAGQRFTVLGIVPGWYRGTNLNWSDPPEAWMPISASALAVPQLREVFHQRSARWLLVMGRLRGGVSAAAAHAELVAIAASLAASAPESNRHVTVEAIPASRAKFWPGHRASVGRLLSVLGGAAGLIVLLACANLANLLLERGFSRRRELAIRLALGAGRARLVAQLLLESVALVLPGFFLAAAVAWGLRAALVGFPNAFGIRLALAPEPGVRTLLLCSLASVGALLLSSLLPALRASRVDIQSALKMSGNAAAPSRRDWLRSSLLVVQVACSMVLLAGGGLVARSLLDAYATDPGFRPSHLLIASFNLDPSRAAGENGTRFAEALLRDVTRLPGVTSATLAMDPPLNPVRVTKQVSVPGSSAPAVPTTFNGVGPDYVRTLGTGLLAGRDFAAADTAASTRVAIVNRALAQRLWGRTEVVGAELLVRERGDRRTSVEVVGVASDSRYHSPLEAAEPQLYVLATQWGIAASHLLVRTAPEPRVVMPTIRQEWRHLAPGVPLDGIRTGEEQLDASLAPQRVAMSLLACFGVLAVALSSVGLYAMVSFAVAVRRREMGIRLAIGASPSSLVGTMLGRAATLVGGGIVAGTAASLGLGRLAGSLVRGAPQGDPLVYGLVALLLAAVALGAALVPARRAAHVDPLVTLRSE